MSDWFTGRSFVKGQQRPFPFLSQLRIGRLKFLSDTPVCNYSTAHPFLLHAPDSGCGTPALRLSTKHVALVLQGWSTPCLGVVCLDSLTGAMSARKSNNKSFLFSLVLDQGTPFRYFGICAVAMGASFVREACCVWPPWYFETGYTLPHVGPYVEGPIFRQVYEWSC